MKRFLFLLFFLFFSLTLAQEGATQEEIEKNKQELSEIKKKLQQIEKRLEKLKSEEKDVLKMIETIEEKTNLTKRLINQFNIAIKNYENLIAQLEKEIKDTEKKIKEKESDIDKLVILLYKIKTRLPLEIYFSNKSLPEIYSKLINLNYIAKENQNQIFELSNLKRKLERDKKELLNAYEEIKTLKEQKEIEEKKLKERKEEQKKLLSKIRNEKKEQEKLQQELKEAEKRLTNLIAELERKRVKRKLPPGAHYLEREKNNLPWPVRGKIISYFGSLTHPKYQTKIKNQGIDIQTEFGTKVIAIAPGRVVYADRFRGYGNMVIIDHNEGYYTVYSNLSEIAVRVNQEVKAKEVIGLSGEYLHFELRKEGQPVNPLEWLSQ
ncbi:MAG: peptidoglycan DD-metalloendopeptidase family protein [candidate division WOR-3 bacterium]|nr:peptidoglycan DD-metalloendopeptidase family protein [candidate division WOR-3 bacterium]MCX7836806.1 peptidoglycan DD-metalloendopeptidase family protein [candidate division WOR-3 bacterium]MDW8113877.1 peptidoglycan DD-metalloendopeptidase family protein [candidate division WOR-3 bacterium]